MEKQKIDSLQDELILQGRHFYKLSITPVLIVSQYYLKEFCPQNKFEAHLNLRVQNHFKTVYWFYLSKK
jgi:hypothetical protein